MAAIHIAVLMTCHNRRETTLSCLRALARQEGIGRVQVQVYLVDDGSCDGTGDAVRQAFPDVKVLEGDGNLYWAGGTRVAFDEAMKSDYDYYLWLNDDTTLDPRAVRIVLDTARVIRGTRGRDGIVVGSTCDPETGERTYGGDAPGNPSEPRRRQPIEPSNKPQRCVTFNGNCVFIPRSIVAAVGSVSPDFTHYLGDTDYGLRAAAKGFSSWIVPGFAGTCPANPNANRWTSPELSLRQRWRLLHSPKGFPPREWLIFNRRHAGLRWIPAMLKLYIRVLCPSLWRVLKRTRPKNSSALRKPPVAKLEPPT